MKKLSLNHSNVLDFLSEKELNLMKEQVEFAHKTLLSKTGAGNDFLGWIELPTNYDKSEFERIKAASEKIKSNSEVFIVIGIGGSYLGAKAAIDFLSHSFYNNLPKNKRKTPEIYFAGQNISGKYLEELMEIIGERDYSVNVISKSGTTTEPAIAFRFFKKNLEERYGVEEARKRIYATTDANKGALKKLALDEGYESFVVPDNVGGRFSVLTAVGLLPIAVAGIDIEELMRGAREAQNDYMKPFEENDCLKYATIRNILHRKGIDVEMLINYEPRLFFIGEWWKQLFAESEGKDRKGILPVTANFSTDLHSVGQYIQDGKRILMETLLSIETPEKDLIIEEDELDLDGLNYLAGKGMDFVNKKATEGTVIAHVDGGVPNIILTIPEATPYHLGYLFYFFEKAVGVSGYLLGVNPFDQPGVEDYKRNMFALLGKKGYEERAKELRDRLSK